MSAVDSDGSILILCREPNVSTRGALKVVVRHQRRLPCCCLRAPSSCRCPSHCRQSPGTNRSLTPGTPPLWASTVTAYRNGSRHAPTHTIACRTPANVQLLAIEQKSCVHADSGPTHAGCLCAERLAIHRTVSVCPYVQYLLQILIRGLRSCLTVDCEAQHHTPFSAAVLLLVASMCLLHPTPACLGRLGH